MIKVCNCKSVRLIVFSCFSLVGFGYKSDRCMVCPYCSSCKWNESRGGERLKIHEGNRKELEGKCFCGIPKKAPFRFSLIPAAKFLSPLPAIPSYLQTYYNQCRVCILEQILPWGAATLCAAFKQEAGRSGMLRGTWLSLFVICCVVMKLSDHWFFYKLFT